MSESVLNNYAQVYVDLILNKTRFDPWDLNWFTEAPFWRRTSMKFSRTYKQIPDYEIGDLKHGKSLDDMYEDAKQLAADLANYQKTAPANEQRRAVYLAEHASQLVVRLALLKGEKMSYDEATKGLYDLVAPAYDYSAFEDIVKDLGSALPGTGSPAEKIRAFRKSIAIPKETLLPVIKQVAKDFHDMSCRYMDLSGQNLPRIRVRELPGAMQFLSVLFGYDYDHIDYERNFNINYPWSVDNLVECVAHECEPGHFVYFEKRTQAYIDTCWPEMSVVSQHTASNAFSEGAARVAIDMCLENDRQKMTDYEREVIFDICGLDKAKAELMPLWHRYYDVMGYGKLEATRKLWDGVWTLEEAGAFLEKYCFNDLGSGVDTIKKAPDDIGHFCAHNYIKDVVKDFFNDVCPDFRDQFKLYEGLCSDDFSMKDILDHSYRFEPYLLK